MSQLTWENMNPLDTSKYLDAIQKAQATSLAGVEQIGNAYKGYYDNLKKQNTNDMLTALNQAQNPEELAAAQANIASMQQRWGTGYDMDAVRTAMDERPTVLMQRQSAEMDFKDKQANVAARPHASAVRMAQLKSLNATDEQLAQIKAIDDMGGDSTAIAESLGQFLTNDRKFKFDEEKWEKDYKQKEDHFTRTLNQSNYQYNRTATREEQESAYRIGKGLYEADQASGAGTVQVAADGTEFTTGGGGGAAIARYASMFGPLAAGMIHTESKGRTNAVSPAGARGIVQIMPKTAANPGYGMPPIDLNNSTPEEQIRWGMEYRSRMQKAHGFTEDQATAAYNAGAGRVQQAIKASKSSGRSWLSHMPKETRNYVPRVNAATAKYGGAAASGNTPSTAPMVGIDRKTQQKIRGEYQEAMLKYNEDLALKDQPVNVGNVLAGLVAKEKSPKNPFKQNAFDIVNAIKENPQIAGLSAEGIANVYNRAKAWQAKPGVPLIGYNSDDGLKDSINNYITDELNNDVKRKEHIAKASHPSNTYIQKIQREFEAAGVSISAKEALLHIDPKRYESLYGTPTVKVQEALNKKEEKAQVATKPNAKPEAKATPPTAAPAASKPKPSPTAKVSNPAPQASPAKPAKPTKQDIVDFYIKRGKVENIMPGGLDGHKDRDLINQAKKEATERLKDIEAKQKAAKEAKKAAERAELAKIRKAYADREAKKFAEARKAKEEEERRKRAAQAKFHGLVK